jgi:CheY-like chemotaxis protein
MSTILVIDDEIKALDLILEMLEYEGYEVLRAENGTTGLRLINERMPDIIFCDVRMPDIDGFAVLKATRMNPRTRAIPFVLISGFDDMALIQRSEELGAFHYLIKPILIHDLLPIIKICTG